MSSVLSNPLLPCGFGVGGGDNDIELFEFIWCVGIEICWGKILWLCAVVCVGGGMYLALHFLASFFSFFLF